MPHTKGLSSHAQFAAKGSEPSLDVRGVLTSQPQSLHTDLSLLATQATRHLYHHSMEQFHSRSGWLGKVLIERSMSMPMVL